MSTPRKRAQLLAGLGIALGLAIVPASAASLDLDFLARFDINDDVHVMLRATTDYFHAPEPQVRQVAVAVVSPEELAVVLFIAKHARVEVSAVVARRQQGAAWVTIMAEFGMSRDRLFLELPADTGPPYGKAHGHKKHGRHVARAALTDADVADLVVLQVTAGFFGQDPESLVHIRRGGKSFAAIQGDLYRSSRIPRPSPHATRPANEDLSIVEPAAKGKSKNKGKKSR